MDKEKIELVGDNHIVSNLETPLREDAFSKTDEEKIANIQHYFGKIMEELGLDLTDDSLSGTPHRVAKMYVKELFYGLDPKKKPKISSFENDFGYHKLLIEQDITIDSACEHHFMPIVGKASIGYLPKERVIGLSKINRIVDYYSHRPQGQERLCLQILNELQDVLDTKDVIVMVHAKHLCVSSRGIKDKSSYTTTVEYGGHFNEPAHRKEFLDCLNNNHNISI